MSESVAIVTGASQGIGRATAVRLAKGFSGLTLAARNRYALKEVEAEVRSSGADPLTVALDLRTRESAQILVRKTLERFGKTDALLNIAGAVPQIDLFEMTDEQWRPGLELKPHGARRLMILAWDALKVSKGSLCCGCPRVQAGERRADQARAGFVELSPTAVSVAHAHRQISEQIQPSHRKEAHVSSRTV